MVLIMLISDWMIIKSAGDENGMIDEYHQFRQLYLIREKEGV